MILSARRIVIGAAGLVFAVICFLPPLYMLGLSFLDLQGRLSFESYRRLLTEARQRDLLATSALLGLGTAGLATLIGASIGLFLARSKIPMKGLFRLALVVPLVLPPYLLSLAWIYGLGPAGLISEAIGLSVLPDWTYSLSGAIVVLALTFYPLAMLATEAAARHVDGHLEEAGLLYTSPRTVALRITLPLIAPSVVASSLIIFVLALAEFGVPALLRVRVFTTEVFTAFAALYDFGAATALSVPLLALAAIAGLAASAFTDERLLVTRRSIHRPLDWPLGHWRPTVIVGLLLFLTISVVMPMAALAYEAGSPKLISDAVQGSFDAIFNSITLAAAGATAVAIIGLLLGYGAARGKRRQTRFLGLTFLVIFAVPSTVVGVGLIGLWNRSDLPVDIYGSRLIIVLAYLARFLPVAALILAANIRQFPSSFEEAAELSGVGWPTTFRRIVLPQVKTGVTAVWLIVFIFALGELGSSVLVSPPGEATLPVRIYTIIANTPPSRIAALALVQALITLILLGVLGLLTHHRRSKP